MWMRGFKLDQRADRFGEGVVVEGRRIAVPLDARLVDNAIDLICGDSNAHRTGSNVENLTAQLCHDNQGCRSAKPRARANEVVGQTETTTPHTPPTLLATRIFSIVVASCSSTLDLRASCSDLETPVKWNQSLRAPLCGQRWGSVRKRTSFDLGCGQRSLVG